MGTWIIHIVNTLYFGMLLFLLASELTLTFGLMKITNLAQAAYDLMRAHIAVEVQLRTGNLLLAVLAVAISISILGVIMERFSLRRLYNELLRQVL